MAGERPLRKIGDLGKVITGKTPSTKRTECFGGEYPFITIPDLDGRRDISTSARTLSHLGADTMTNCQLPAGAVMMSCIATIGKCGITTRPSFTNQQINSVICGDHVDPKFLYYSFSQLGPALDTAGGGGSVYTNVSKSRFSAIEVLLPPLKEQQAIACILGALDDKIELNRRRNKTLEATARAIFKSWFVDFDPVRAKAAGQEPPGLKPDLAALFPDAFEDSELGEIPKGWSASNVVQHFRLTMGQSPPGSTYNETGDGVPFYQGRTDFGFRFPTRRVFCTAPTRFAEPDDTLVSVRAPVGDVNMASERCAVGRGVAAIRHRNGSRSFTYCSMHHLGEHFGQFEAEGTVFGCINKSDFERLPFIAPSKEVLAAFDRVVSPLDDRIETGERQTSILAGLRDALLPKLISGELRVPDAERIAGRRT